MWSPSTTAPVCVDREAPVGVAVEGEAGVGPVLDDGLLQVVEVRRAAVVVDVEAVGLGVDRDDRGAELLEHLAARPRYAAPLAQSSTTVRPSRRRGRGVDEVLDVRADARVAVADAADVGAGRAVPRLLEAVLDQHLEVVVELEPAAGEELDAVVGHRRCGSPRS